MDNEKKFWLAVSRANDEERNEVLTNFFLKFPVQEISFDEQSCQETLRKRSVEVKSSLENEFCVTSVIQDIVLCKKGIGAPLQIFGGDYFHIGGLASFIADCQKNEPVLVTRITSHVEWIEERVWPDDNGGMEFTLAN